MAGPILRHMGTFGFGTYGISDLMASIIKGKTVAALCMGWSGRVPRSDAASVDMSTGPVLFDVEQRLPRPR